MPARLLVRCTRGPYYMAELGASERNRLSPGGPRRFLLPLGENTGGGAIALPRSIYTVAIIYTFSIYIVYIGAAGG